MSGPETNTYYITQPDGPVGPLQGGDFPSPVSTTSSQLLWKVTKLGDGSYTIISGSDDNRLFIQDNPVEVLVDKQEPANFPTWWIRLQQEVGDNKFYTIQLRSADPAPIVWTLRQADGGSPPLVFLDPEGPGPLANQLWRFVVPG